MGSPVSKIFGALLFRVRHPKRTLRDLDKALGLKATHHAEVGSLRNAWSGGIWKESVWTAQSVLKTPRFTRDISKVLAKARKRRPLLKSITRSGGSIQIYLQLAGPHNIGDRVPLAMLSEMTALGIALEVEVFPTMQNSWRGGR
jgi:hypothetical protein